jgi:hypothetical protein
MRICNLDSAAARSGAVPRVHCAAAYAWAWRGVASRTGGLEDDGFLRAWNADQELTD